MIDTFCRSLRLSLRLLRRLGRRALFLGGTCLVAACQSAPVPETPIVVTEVYEIAGEEVVITRVVTSTSNPSPTNTEQEATPIPPPVVLDIGTTQTPGTFDPQLAAYGVTNKATIDILENIYAGLTRYNHVTNRIEPELADSWSLSADGRTWTFNLRTDIWWVRAESPGINLLTEREATDVSAEMVRIQPIVADDVVMAVERACDPQTNTPYAFTLFLIEGCQDRNITPVAEGENAAVIGVRAVDDQTLQVTLREPAAYFLAMTTLPVFRPVPAFLIEDPETDWLDAATFLTSGPFVLNPFSDADAGLTILQRNPHWPLPTRGNVEFVNLFEFDRRLDAYRVWEENLLDIVPLPIELTGDFLSNPDIRPPIVTNAEMFYLGYNFDSPLFSIPEVRRAFGSAIDRERLIREVYGDRGAPMIHFVPPGVLHALPIDQVGLSYSPSRARAELRDGGFISCTLMGEMRYMISASDLALQHAEALVRMWSENLGCDENQFIIEQVQFGTLLARTRRDAGPTRPDLWDLGWASFYPDAHDWFDTVLHCENSENRQNRVCVQADVLMEDASVTFNVDERAAIYRQIENFMFGEGGLYPVAPLYVRGDYVLRQPWVTYTPSLFGGEQFDIYLVEQATKEIERSQ